MSFPAAELAAHRYRRQQEHGIAPVRSVPDRELVATLVAHGQPAWSARRDITNPQARLVALRFWADVQDAKEGDKAAQMRVDYVRQGFAQMRCEELIADNPARMHTDLVDPKELL